MNESSNVFRDPGYLECHSGTSRNSSSGLFVSTRLSPTLLYCYLSELNWTKTFRTGSKKQNLASYTMIDRESRLSRLIEATKHEDWPKASELLYEHWSTMCPRVYGPRGTGVTEQPWEGFGSENQISK